ncbi:MAG TPA: DUF3500 domain-containing protein [Actinomycetota bacterium]|jgi:hypothetical protein|nr:DUF3500 domain-containing protein [Actinomycetota bacterium]
MAEAAPGPAGADRLAPVRDAMAAAAADWLASLGPAERAKASYPFPADEERTRWYYTPTERGGLPLAEMGPVSQRLAHRLVASGLSEGGYATAATVMGLENVLDAREGWRRGYDGRTVPHRGRDPQLYFVSVFGQPGAGAWGWRVGGHHVALNYTVGAGGQVSASPLFLGANPGLTRLVGPGVLRPLAAEEDLARELLDALAPDQRATALLSSEAPGDILQRNRPVARAGPPEGLAAAGMLPQQRALLEGLLDQYLGRLPGPLAALERERVAGERLEAVHFGWAGGAERGQPHYYRLQGPRLLIEYDNVQDGANHVHSVWRDPEGDFGQSSAG